MERTVECAVLPVGRTVNVPVGDGSLSGIAARLERTLNLQAHTITLLEKSSGGKFVEVAEIETDTTLFALVRCRAGGKGGFKKQLEKKGREFARAQRAEERAKRHSAANVKRSNKERGEKQPITTKSASTTPPQVNDFVASMNANTTACRLLAKQGVAMTIAKALQKSTAPPQ